MRPDLVKVFDNDFSTNTLEGWQIVGLAPLPSPSISGGVVNFTNVKRYDGIQKSFATVPGMSYTVDLSLVIGTMDRIHVWTYPSNDANNSNRSLFLSNGDDSYTFVATGENTTIRIRAQEYTDAYFNAAPRSFGVDAVVNRQQGTVVVSFVVETSGAISEIKILKGVVKSLDDEAVRVVRKMKRWNPATINGIAVRSKVELPIIFTLD